MANVNIPDLPVLAEALATTDSIEVYNLSALENQEAPLSAVTTRVVADIDAGGTALTIYGGTTSLGSVAAGGLVNNNFVMADAAVSLVDSAKAVPAGAVVGTSDTQTLTAKTLTNPVIAQINDANGNEALKLTATASAVNEHTFANAATGNAPVAGVSGGDTNIDHAITAKGTGIVRGPLIAIPIAMSDRATALTTGIKWTYYMPRAFTLFSMHGSVTTAPTGATLIVDVHKDGTTVMTTNKIVIDVSEFDTSTAATAPALTTTALAAGSKMEFEVDQIGSTVAGAGLTVTMLGYWT